MVGREEVVERASCPEGVNASVAARDSNVKSISPVVSLLVQDSALTNLAKLVEPEHLHRRCLRITVEDRIDMLHDVGAHVEKVPLVLDGNERTLGAVVPGDL